MSTYLFCYLVIAEDGTTTVHERDADDDAVTAILTDAVGGLFATFATDYPDLVFWCNEEGLPLRLPDNPVATAMAFLLGGPTQMLVGPVVVTGQAADRVHPLTKAHLDSLLTLAAICRH
jgi:hypothetical protein